MMKILMRFQGRCPKHRYFHPERDGQGAIRGGCLTCQELAEIAAAADRFRKLAAEFDRKTTLATVHQMPRKRVFACVNATVGQGGR